MNRFNISLRHMLLWMTLFAVLFAWIGTREELRLIQLREQIQELEWMRKSAEVALSHPGEESIWRNRIREIDAQLKARQSELDDVTRLSGSNTISSNALAK